MHLLTERLVLRPWARSDAPALTALQNDSYEHLRTYMAWSDRPYTVSDMEARIEGWAGQERAGTDRLMGVFEKDTGLPVGEVGLHPRSGARRDENPCMVSYWVGSEYEGRGYAREALSAFLLTLSVPAACVMIEDDNHRSLNLARRLGFVLEGRHDRFLLLRKDLRPAFFDSTGLYPAA